MYGEIQRENTVVLENKLYSGFDYSELLLAEDWILLRSNTNFDKN